MKTDVFLKLQKKYGGHWVASSEDGRKVYAAGKNVDVLFKELEKKHVAPTETVIGFIEPYGQLSVYVSLSVQTK